MPALAEGVIVGCLTLGEKTFYFTPGGRRTWVFACLCSCGNETTILENSLRRGATASCGCLRRHIKQLDPNSDLAALLMFMRGYENRARSNDRPFNLTFAYFESLARGACHYCNRKPSRVVGRHRKDGELMHMAGRFNGIDRMDPTQGYLMPDSSGNGGNCLPCCSACNSSKRDKTYAEYIEWRWAQMENGIAQLVRDGVMASPVYR